MTKTSISQTLLSVLGVLAALAAAELALRPWASAWREKPYVRAAEVRQYYEGVAVAHYASDGERLTGNPVSQGAANLLILGDSHVEALQVNDVETMGAILESHARSAGHNVNVHQYGWSSAAAPTYASVAPELLNRWDPDVAVVMLNPGDIEQAYYGPIRIEMQEDASVPKIAGERSEHLGAPTDWKSRFVAPILKRSVLAYHLYRSGRMMEEAARLHPNSPIDESAPPSTPGSPYAVPAIPEAALASVRLLKAAYGPRLLIVYDMHLHGLHTRTVDEGPVERSLMKACAQEGVRCVSTRAMFTHDRLTRTRFSRGFSNSSPGVGHWNQTGHALIGEMIWKQLQTQVGRR